MNLKFFLGAICLLMLVINSKAQSNPNYGLESTVEHILTYKLPNGVVDLGIDSEFEPIGYYRGDVMFCYQTYNNGHVNFWLFDERSSTFQEVSNNGLVQNKYSGEYNSSEGFIVYSIPIISEDDDNDGFSKLYFYNNGKSIVIDSIYNSDKNIKTNISVVDNSLLVTSLNELADRYYPKQDDYIWSYDLRKLSNGIIDKKGVFCKYCSNANIVGDKIFFNKSNERDDFDGGYFWKDLYVAPKENINDTVKVATRTEYVAASPDGKYVLGIRHDLQNYFVVIDVAQKKYQLLLGREYCKGKAFYSESKGMFAISALGVIVYIEYPKAFPFDALNKDCGNIYHLLIDREFYRQFKKTPEI